MWDPTESGSTAPISHKRASFPPPLVIRSFYSSVLRPKRPKTVARRQCNESAPIKAAGDLENKVGTLTLQVCEMMGLMKTLVSRKLKSDDNEEGLEDGRTRASPLRNIKGDSEVASVLETSRVSMSGPELNQHTVDLSHAGVEQLGKEDDGGGL